MTLHKNCILTVTKNFAETRQRPVIGHTIEEADLEDVKHRLGGHQLHVLAATTKHALRAGVAHVHHLSELDRNLFVQRRFNKKAHLHVVLSLF